MITTIYQNNILTYTKVDFTNQPVYLYAWPLWLYTLTNHLAKRNKKTKIINLDLLESEQLEMLQYNYNQEEDIIYIWRYSITNLFVSHFLSPHSQVYIFE